MGPTQYTQAVVDRIVDDQAVLLFEDDREQLVVPAADLPEQAREDGGVVTVGFEDGEVCDITYDAAETATRRERIQGKLDRLSRSLSEDEEN